MKSTTIILLWIILINVASTSYINKEHFLSSFCNNIKKIIEYKEFQTSIKNICIDNCYRYYKQDYQFCKEFVEIKTNKFIHYLINDYCKEYNNYFPEITCYLNEFYDFNY